MKQVRYKEIFFFLIASSIILIALIVNIDTTRTEYFYDFEDDAINSFPKGFVGVGRIDTTKVVAWDFDDGHKGKVVQIVYLEENPYDYTGTELNTLFSKATEGFVSFDIYIKHGLRIGFDICQEDPIWDSDDDVSIYSIRLIELCKWYRLEVSFNCLENKWNIKIYREGTLIKFNTYNFDVQPPYMCQLYFATYEIGSEFYIDNVSILLDTLL